MIDEFFMQFKKIYILKFCLFKHMLRHDLNCSIRDLYKVRDAIFDIVEAEFTVDELSFTLWIFKL